jgi:hypothetical protein
MNLAFLFGSRMVGRHSGRVIKSIDLTATKTNATKNETALFPTIMGSEAHTGRGQSRVGSGPEGPGCGAAQIRTRIANHFLCARCADQVGPGAIGSPGKLPEPA